MDSGLRSLRSRPRNDRRGISNAAQQFCVRRGEALPRPGDAMRRPYELPPVTRMAMAKDDVPRGIIFMIGASRAVRGLERDREMAGRDLSGRRGDVLPLVLSLVVCAAVDAAVHRPFGIRHAPAARPYRARPVAVDLADLHRHRVQPDAACRRHRDQFLGAAVVRAAVGSLAQGARRSRCAGPRCCRDFSACSIVANPGADSLTARRAVRARPTR